MLELEDELGTRLFERSPRGMVLTPQGHRFLASARKVIASVAEAKLEAAKKVLTEASAKVAGFAGSEPADRAKLEGGELAAGVTAFTERNNPITPV